MFIALIILTLLCTYAGVVYKRRRIVYDGHSGEPYLVRYFLFYPRFLRKRLGIPIPGIYLHHILRSDYDRALHDHPWNFVSVILWGGYREWADFRCLRLDEQIETLLCDTWKATGQYPLCYRDFKAGSILHRGAGWRHRLELTKPAWTLVFRTRTFRNWGFWTNLGTKLEKWCHFKRYDYNNGICED
jgi:hypothetical protein